MKRCTDMVALMSEEVDGRLDGETREDFMAHLEACAACRRAYDELIRTLSLVRAVPPKPAPPDMVARVRRRLERPHAAFDMASVFNRPPVRMALAASFLLFISIYALRRPEVVREIDEIPRHSVHDTMEAKPVEAPAAKPAAPDLDMPAGGFASPLTPDSPDSRRQEAAPVAEAVGPARPDHAASPPARPAPPLTVPDPSRAPSGVARSARADGRGRIWQVPSEASAPPGLSVGADAAERDEQERRPLPRAMAGASGPRQRRPDGVAESATFDRLGNGAREDLAEAEDGLAVAREFDVPPGRAQRAEAVAAAAPPPGVDTAAGLVVANRAFAADMYRELAALQDGNILFSPYSMHAALGMAYAGADGETAREMAAALSWPHARTELPPAFRALDRQVTAAARAGGQKLSIANGLCLTGGNVDADYRALLRNAFGAEIFTGGLAEINAWAARKTDGLIDRILDQLSPNSVCVLMNAIYFKGTWRERFDPAFTREAPFHLAPNRRTSVSMMRRTGRYRLLETAEYQALAIPYQGDRLSMIVVLPREIDGMAALESRLSAQTLADWSTALGRQPERRVQVHLPRFKLETAYDLVQPCRNLGMRKAFMTDAADFSGMGWPKGELWISQIRHKAVMAVDEEGTEAAAVTAVEMQTRSVQPPDPVFRADRPFLFLIHDNSTGCILFMGRLRDIQPIPGT